jgi:hypothetical protein
LSEWKAGGYQDWLARQETLACARELAGDASELAEAADGSLADHLSVVLCARNAGLVSGWNGEMDKEFQRKVRALRSLRQDIVVLSPNFVAACEDSWGRNPTAETRWTQRTPATEARGRGQRTGSRGPTSKRIKVNQTRSNQLAEWGDQPADTTVACAGGSSPWGIPPAGNRPPCK